MSFPLDEKGQSEGRICNSGTRRGARMCMLHVVISKLGMGKDTLGPRHLDDGPTTIGFRSFPWELASFSRHSWCRAIQLCHYHFTSCICKVCQVEHPVNVQWEAKLLSNSDA